MRQRTHQPQFAWLIFKLLNFVPSWLVPSSLRPLRFLRLNVFFGCGGATPRLNAPFGAPPGNDRRKQSRRHGQKNHRAERQRPVNADQPADHADRHAAEGA
jgi:hypothetical protein